MAKDKGQRPVHNIVQVAIQYNNNNNNNNNKDKSQEPFNGIDRYKEGI